MSIRIDRFFSSQGILSRKECCNAAKKGRISVNGTTVKDPSFHINEESDEVRLDGEKISYQRYFYLMLNKPAGYISSTEKSEDTVMKLLPPEYEKAGCFPCGRLDKDTTGLLIVTNDGETAHKLLSPKKHVQKTYHFRCLEELSDEDRKTIENGIDLGDFTSEKCFFPFIDRSGKEGDIVITEGKYHEIKRLFLAVNNEITQLKRTAFGGVVLDSSLEEGQYRHLSPEEVTLLTER